MRSTYDLSSAAANGEAAEKTENTQRDPDVNYQTEQVLSSFEFKTIVDGSRFITEVIIFVVVA